MKKYWLSIFMLIGLLANTYAQSNDANTDQAIIDFKKVLKWINEDDIIALSKHVIYPLERFDQLPAINNESEFQAYYSKLFDASMKTKLNKVSFEDWKMFTHHSGSVGLELGKIWMTKDGKIKSFHYQSETELKNNRELKLGIQSLIHASVNDWEQNLAYIHNNKFIIRVEDLGGNKYRYVSWSKPKGIGDKPDLVLNRTDCEYISAEGNAYYEFQNGIWTYEVSKIVAGKQESENGWFISIYKNDKKVVSYPCYQL